MGINDNDNYWYSSEPVVTMLQMSRGWSSDVVWVGEGEGATGTALVIQKPRRLAVRRTWEEP